MSVVANVEQLSYCITGCNKYICCKPTCTHKIGNYVRLRRLDKQPSRRLHRLNIRRRLSHRGCIDHRRLLHQPRRPTPGLPRRRRRQPPPLSRVSAPVNSARWSSISGRWTVRTHWPTASRCLEPSRQAAPVERWVDTSLEAAAGQPHTAHRRWGRAVLLGLLEVILHYRI